MGEQEVSRMTKALGIYCAGPLYSSGMLDRNVVEAVRTGRQIEQAGRLYGVVLHAMVVHSGAYAEQLIAPRTHVEAQTWDDFWLSRCDAVFRMEGVSRGADWEVSLAGTLGIPVFTELTSLLDWARAKLGA